MATSNERITDHFTHPNHTLRAVTSISGNYTCDGCKLTGSGKRFSCGTCQFNLHDYCARAPATLSNFMDPHQLRLTVHEEYTCDVCSKPINGMTYSCRACNIDVHPGCTSYPEYIDLDIDSKHYLKLQMDRTQRECDICHKMCKYMRYSCRECNVDVHVQCMAGWKPRPAAAAATRDGGGGGGGGNDGNAIVDFLKVTWKITAFIVNVTTGIPLPDF